MSNSVQPGNTHTTNLATTNVPTQENSVATLLKELRIHGKSRSRLVGASAGSALEGIWSNRTRSFLTTLGIVIGIASVIGALTLTQGVGAYITNIITSQGASTITIYGRSQSSGSGSGDALPSLTPHDLHILKDLPHVQGTSPDLELFTQITYGNHNWQTAVQGVSSDFQKIQNWQLAQGLWFNSVQDAEGEAVAVIGDTTATNLFGAAHANAIGKKIHIGQQIYQVEGILTPRGGGVRADDVIFVPYKKLQSLFPPDIKNFFNQIYVQADAASNVDLVVQEITTILAIDHRIQPGKPNDFDTQTSAQLLQQTNQSIQAITLLLTSIAAISLTVGGIGIMNIMLVSVTERTREIGIRMSVGARRRDIRNQFLIEALILCLLGGFIGLLLGVLIGWIMVGVILSLAIGGSSGSVAPVITTTTLVLPFAVSLGIGLVFGLYPAIRASRLDPIVALRRAK